MSPGLSWDPRMNFILIPCSLILRKEEGKELVPAGIDGFLCFCQPSHNPPESERAWLFTAFSTESLRISWWTTYTAWLLRLSIWDQDRVSFVLWAGLATSTFCSRKQSAQEAVKLPLCIVKGCGENAGGKGGRVERAQQGKVFAVKTDDLRSQGGGENQPPANCAPCPPPISHKKTDKYRNTKL